MEKDQKYVFVSLDCDFKAFLAFHLVLVLNYIKLFFNNFNVL